MSMARPDSSLAVAGALGTSVHPSAAACRDLRSGYLQSARMGEAGEPRASEGDRRPRSAKDGGKDGAKRRRRRRGSSRRSRGATAGGERTATSTRTKGTAVRATPARTKNVKRAKAAKGAARTRTKRGRPKRPAAPTKREVSAGGVVYRRSDDGIEIVLASRRTRRGQLAWGLAKGGIEGDESMEDAAERSGRRPGSRGDRGLPRRDPLLLRLGGRADRKTVHFFLMRHTGGDIDDRDDEMEEIRWFPSSARSSAPPTVASGTCWAGRPSCSDEFARDPPGDRDRRGVGLVPASSPGCSASAAAS